MKKRLIKLRYFLTLIFSLLFISSVQANTAKIEHCKSQCMPDYIKCSNSVSKLCHRQHIQVMDQTGRITTPTHPSPNQLNAYESCRVRHITGCSDQLKECERKCS